MKSAAIMAAYFVFLVSVLVFIMANALDFMCWADGLVGTVSRVCP